MPHAANVCKRILCRMHGSFGLSDRRGGIVLKLLLGAGAFFFVLMVVTAIFVDVPDYEPPARTVAEEPEPEPAQESLTAMVNTADGQLFVTNLDDFDWTSCRVMLNPGTFNDGYYQDVASIAAGDVAGGGLMAFANGDGERFNPGALVIRDVTVRCDTPKGTLYYFGSM